MQWSHLTSALVSCVEDYFRQIDRGLRTKKVARLDPEPTTDEGHYTLGLSSASMIGYQLGMYLYHDRVPAGYVFIA